MKKKNLVLVCFLVFILSCCSKDNERVYPIHVVNERLIPIEIKELNKAEISMGYKLIGDTLKCKVRTIHIHKNDTIDRVYSEMQKNNLFIKIYSSPNSFCWQDSCWAAHEISFDLLRIKPDVYRTSIVVNSHEYNLFVDLSAM